MRGEPRTGRRINEKVVVRKRRKVEEEEKKIDFSFFFFFVGERNQLLKNKIDFYNLC
jgi:hypothetical protein